MVTVYDQFITPEQYVAFTGDGVYDRLKVEHQLDRHYGRKGQFLWDLMHLAATIDTLMRAPDKDHSDKFKWLNEMTDIIRKCVTFVKLGVEWARFFKVFDILFLIFNIWYLP